MNKIVLLSSAVVFSLVSGIAGAVTLKNTDKTETSVIAEIGGKKEELKLKENGMFDSKGKDVTFTLGKEKPVSGKGEEAFIIKGGKIEAVLSAAPTATPTASAPVAVEPVKPAVVTPEPVKTTAPEAK